VRLPPGWNVGWNWGRAALDYIGNRASAD